MTTLHASPWDQQQAKQAAAAVRDVGFVLAEIGKVVREMARVMVRTAVLVVANNLRQEAGDHRPFIHRGHPNRRFRKALKMSARASERGSS